MNENKYLVDTNALSRLTRKQRASAFVRWHCRIPSAVLHEATGLPDYAALTQLEYPVTPAILEQVRVVMHSVPARDLKLVNLYSNKGNADPILIATALAAGGEPEALWETVWRVVSDDRAVRDKAAAFGIEWLSSAELATLTGT